MYPAQAPQSSEQVHSFSTVLSHTPFPQQLSIVVVSQVPALQETSEQAPGSGQSPSFSHCGSRPHPEIPIIVKSTGNISRANGFNIRKSLFSSFELDLSRSISGQDNSDLTGLRERHGLGNPTTPRETPMLDTSAAVDCNADKPVWPIDYPLNHA
jgi:hypothetical protein